MVATVVYGLCALTSLACSALLLRMFWQHRHHASRLLFWSSLAFAGFAVSNALMFADLVAWPAAGLAAARAGTACLASTLLLFGLIWDTE